MGVQGLGLNNPWLAAAVGSDGVCCCVFGGGDDQIRNPILGGSDTMKMTMIKKLILLLGHPMNIYTLFKYKKGKEIS